MIRLIAIGFSIVLSILLLSTISWFEMEETKIAEINKKNLIHIENFKKIQKINVWLEKYVKPSIMLRPDTALEAEENLVKYFDNNAVLYDFLVSKYIYSDGLGKYLDVMFEVKRENRETLGKLMDLHFKKGFLQFKEFKLDTDSISGNIQIIQPFSEDNNES